MVTVRLRGKAAVREVAVEGLDEATRVQELLLPLKNLPWRRASRLLARQRAGAENCCEEWQE